MKEQLVDAYENLLYRMPWKIKSTSKIANLNEDEIFLDVFPIYQNLDGYLVTNEESYRWSALRSAVRALRTVAEWSNPLSLTRLGDARQTLGKVRQVMNKRLLPTIASGDRASLNTARDAIENFLTILVDSSAKDLRNVIATFQSLAFPSYA